MSKYYFLSDMHLGNRNQDDLKEKRFISFLKQLPVDTAGLYLLGDIFDYWLEYKTVIFLQFFNVLSELKNVLGRGIKIYFVVGNHDFAAGNFFKKCLPIEIFYGPVSVELNGLRVFLHHGDGISPRDVGYRRLKRFLRYPLTKSVLRLIHPDFAIYLMHLLSGCSHIYTDKINHGEKEAIFDMAKQKLGAGYDAIICGHSHEPVSKDGYYNLGDWQEYFTYLYLEDKEFSLRKFECPI